MTPWFVVTAVVGDVQNGSFESPLGTLAVYQLRSAESNVWFYQSIVVRVASDRRHVETAIRDIVKRLNSHVAVAKVDPASAVIMDMNARLQFTTWVMVGFSAVAGFLALIGVYGAFWYVVRRRTREIAVRIALGAEQRDVVWMILTACGRWALIGIAVGVPTAIVATRTLASLLYGTSPANPLTYSAVCVGLFGAAIAAAWWPARRASRLDPAAALRAE
jgi:ABC-type antimicrobial peptide transport system permease subunit